MQLYRRRHGALILLLVVSPRDGRFNAFPPRCFCDKITDRELERVFVLAALEINCKGRRNPPYCWKCVHCILFQPAAAQQEAAPRLDQTSSISYGKKAVQCARLANVSPNKISLAQEAECFHGIILAFAEIRSVKCLSAIVLLRQRIKNVEQFSSWWPQFRRRELKFSRGCCKDAVLYAAAWPILLPRKACAGCDNGSVTLIISLRSFLVAISLFVAKPPKEVEQPNVF